MTHRPTDTSDPVPARRSPWRRRLPLLAGGVLLLVLGLGLVLRPARAGQFEDTIDQLGSADATVRQSAVKALVLAGAMNNDTLIDLLDGDLTPLAKAGLADALVQIGIDAGERSELEILSTGGLSIPARVAATRVLASAPTGSGETLAGMATDETERLVLRASAIRGLGGTGAGARNTLKALANDLELAPSLRHGALRSLALVSAAGVSDVGDVVRDSDRTREDRIAALEALTQSGSASVSELTSIANTVKGPGQAHVLMALARRAGASAAATLASGLSSGSARVKATAIETLVQVGQAGTYRTQIIGLLGNANPRVQALAAETVGATCSDIASTVKPTLVSMLGSASFRVRHASALALFQLDGDTTGAATMLTDSSSPNASVAAQAAQAYSLISGT